MTEGKEHQLLSILIDVHAMQEQLVHKMDSVEKRLSNIELKVGRIEKCVSYENADFEIRKAHAV